MSSLDSSAFESNEEDYLAKLNLRHRKLTKRSPSQCNRNNSNNDSASDDDGAGGDGAKSKASLEGRFGGLEDSDVEEVIDVEESSGLPRPVYEQCQKSFEGNRFKPILQGIKGHKLEKYMLDITRNNEATVIEEADEDDEVEGDIFYYEAPVMIELIKEDRIVKDKELWVPSSHTEARDAMKKVKEAEVNSSLRQFAKLFPFWPLSHELPELDLPDELPDWSDKALRQVIQLKRMSESLFIHHVIQDLMQKVTQLIAGTTYPIGTSTPGAHIV